MAEETFKQVLMEVWGASEDELVDSATPDDIDGWDSIAHMEVVGRFAEEFDIDLDVDEVTQMDSIANMRQVLRSHGVQV